jgi:prepilin-type N-terminal cleavage/methylation domain-containing protein
MLGTKKSEKCHADRKAFTLLEVLIVMTIISVMTALLLPAFSAVKQKTILLQCQENLRQIGFGFHQYASAWNDFWPARVADNMNKEGTCWPTRIEPYIAIWKDWTHGLWRCPNNTPRSTLALSVSYGMVEVKFDSYVQSGKVPSPERSILLGEGRPLWDIDSFSLKAPNGLELWIHDGWVNLLYADLHTDKYEIAVLENIRELTLPWDIDLNGD